MLFQFLDQFSSETVCIQNYGVIKLSAYQNVSLWWYIRITEVAATNKVAYNREANFDTAATESERSNALNDRSPLFCFMSARISSVNDALLIAAYISQLKRMH